MTTFKALFKTFRVHQWTKNLFIFAALIFSHNLPATDKIITSILAFIAFSLTASAVYIINDIKDLGYDKQHPNKRHRPLPSGDLSTGTALTACIILIITGGALALFIGKDFAIVLLIYLLLNILYSFKLKQVVIVDLLIVASGFLLRVVSGAVAIDVEISSWLLICAALLALLLVLGKRRQEVKKYEALEHWSAIKDNYSISFLDQMINAIAASTITAYLLYTLSESTISRLGSRNLIFSVPFVLYGIFRYIYLLHSTELAETPEKIILTDRPFIINLVCWILITLVIIYV